MSDAARDLVARAARVLGDAGVPSPEHDAWELLEHASGLSRFRLLALRDAIPGVDAYEEHYVPRRAAREPLQHITGRSWFRHVELAVGPGVFVPRPETELVAGEAVDEARRATAEGRAPVVVDLGTGSGAIALSVAVEVPGSRVYAVELDPAAHSWAERNLAGRGVALHRGDMADAYPELDGAVDVVVSNPPYIPVGAVVRDAEVAEHDPTAALWSGADGLDALRVVARAAARLLRPGGLVAAEHADLQGKSAPAVFAATGEWDAVADHRDLAGRPRYVTARRRALP